MITVEVFLLKHHAPSSNINRIVELYLGNAAGVVLRKTWVESGDHLVETLQKNKIKNLPAMIVPGRRRGGWVETIRITDREDIEEWCKDTVQKIDGANRRGRR